MYHGSRRAEIWNEFPKWYFRTRLYRRPEIGEIPIFGIFPILAPPPKRDILPRPNVPSVEKPAKIYSTKWRPKWPFLGRGGTPPLPALCTDPCTHRDPPPTRGGCPDPEPPPRRRPWTRVVHSRLRCIYYALRQRVHTLQTLSLYNLIYISILLTLTLRALLAYHRCIQRLVFRYVLTVPTCG